MAQAEPFVPVARLSDFARVRGRTVQVDGVRIAVLRDGDQFVAVADACPHMGASLADGRVEGGAVVCAWHGWRYDTATGRGLPPSRPWACVRVHEVRVEGDRVLVRRPEPVREAPNEGDREDGR